MVPLPWIVTVILPHSIGTVKRGNRIPHNAKINGHVS
jgi:hypothetical protein